jgi:hypothetical protein
MRLAVSRGETTLKVGATVPDVRQMVRQAELGPAKAAGRPRFEDGDGSFSSADG